MHVKFKFFTDLAETLMDVYPTRHVRDPNAILLNFGSHQLSAGIYT